MSYTELEKMKIVEEKSHIIGEFLDWLLNTKGILLCKYSGDYYHNEFPKPLTQCEDDLLAEYFSIDLKKAEQEKRAVLEGLRK